MNNFIPTKPFVPKLNQEQEVLEEDNIDTLLCFSHLRWNFVFQRPQHLMTRAAEKWRVFYIEEPVVSDTITTPDMMVLKDNQNLLIVTPQFPRDYNSADYNPALENMLAKLLIDFKIDNYGVWYYTPMALKFTLDLLPRVIVYDCMDELSAFRGAPHDLLAMESRLLNMADLVFTGGNSLYEAKKNRHSHVYAFPSSIDKAHFMQARQELPEPADQEEIMHPRLGFYGVVDERFDIELLRQLAQRRPDWQFIIIGPVVKIDYDTLPKNNNIHYLGMKSYQELPVYLSGWDVALLLFALNESTRYISPTKTPEYLAAFKPVVSTPIQDVVVPYEGLGLVSIADNPFTFETAIEDYLENNDMTEWEKKVESFLATNSWDITWQQMRHLMNQRIIIT